MIHTFTMHGIHIATDVSSGAVHVVSDLVYRLLKQFPEMPPQECPKDILAQLLQTYTQEEITEAMVEIHELVRQGLLYTEDPYATMAPYIRKQPVIKALCLHVSHDCNLRCGYCFAGTGNFCGARELMSVEVGKKAIDFVIAHSGERKNIEIDFFGGEPLMNFDVVKELTFYAREQEKKHHKVFRLTLTTNAVLLDDEKLTFINEHMHNLVLSTDGRKNVNDNMRKTVSGDGCYDIIMPKITAAAQSRKQDNYYVRGTFTRHNLDFAADVLHLADQGFRQISVEPVVGGADTNYALRECDLPKIYEQYESLAKEYAKRQQQDDWFNFFHFMIDLEQGPCVIKRMSGCGAGCEYIAVTPDGDLYPCHQFVGNEAFRLGNVLDDSYNADLAQNFADTNVYTKPACTQCWARFYCSGGCHANAYQFSGTLNEPYEIGCDLERKRVECALYAKAYEAQQG